MALCDILQVFDTDLLTQPVVSSSFINKNQFQIQEGDKKLRINKHHKRKECFLGKYEQNSWVLILVVGVLKHFF